jgi:hypothetical protein
MIMKCGCTHPVQDSLYGKGRRVFNKTPEKKAGGAGARCTVCGGWVGLSKHEALKENKGDKTCAKE